MPIDIAPKSQLARRLTKASQYIATPHVTFMPTACGVYKAPQHNADRWGGKVLGYD
jgi:hypothetical protein